MARTPEELEILLEDALLMQDAAAVAALFEAGALLHLGEGWAARGLAFPELALETRGGGQPYLAEPHRVLAVRGLALIETDSGVNVARRVNGGEWRYAIVQQRCGSKDGWDEEETQS